MNVDWSFSLNLPRFFEYSFQGIIFLLQDVIHFYYRDCDEVYAFSGKTKSMEAAYRVPLGKNRSWRFFNDGKPYAVVNDEAAIDLSSNEMISPLPKDLFRKYIQSLKPNCYYEEAPFAWQNYLIEHSGVWGYTCKKDGKQIWKFVGQGYLYTDMLFSPERVMFGTAGQGGYFYILNLETGIPILSLKTKGTIYFEKYGDSCFVLNNEKTAYLLRVDIHTGEVIDRCPLPGVSSPYGMIKLVNNKLYAITFQKKKDKLVDAYWSQISF